MIEDGLMYGYFNTPRLFNFTITKYQLLISPNSHGQSLKNACRPYNFVDVNLCVTAKEMLENKGKTNWISS